MVMQRDYLVRMIWQFTDMLGQMIGLRKQRKTELIEVKMDEWLGNNLGISLELVRGLSAEDLIQLLTGGKPMEADKLILIAKLLREDGESVELQTGPDQAFPLYNKALKLFLHAHGQGKVEVDYLEPNQEIEQLIEKVHPYTLEPQLLKDLSQYFEESGRYDRAEDYWFEWKEHPEAGETAIPYGMAMYERWLSLPDLVLEKGNLPREEVLEALQQLESIQAARREAEPT
ncbi:DUF6483 family protein [Paenibacillus senegalensis]|uniref:DUF6483 family protein n=1 Tax=Paenibacillus senegalensis TaxID=1465766 RepID=UPI0002890997|nr:DUF6483 family protein [Paenibacillus senegalensis]